EEISDHVKQKIAAEVNLSETAFVSRLNDCEYRLRWFTPTVEVDLCGHATLATAFVLFNVNKQLNQLTFRTKSEKLLRAQIDRVTQMISLQFPSNPPKAITSNFFSYLPKIIENVVCGVDVSVNTLLYSQETKKLIIHLANDVDCLRKIKPNFEKLLSVEQNDKIRGVSVVVEGDGESIDFHSRYFSPWNGLNEDPVNGSSHTILTPYWCGLKRKSVVVAKQESRRGGILFCKLMSDCVQLSGKCNAMIAGKLRIRI
ncbi:phenazine biosynthesis-like domain-containing protein, partial [Dinothrombium tinctorium]